VIASPAETLAQLTATRDLYFSCLLWSSGAVAIGVALEGPGVVHETRRVFSHLKTEARAWVTLVALLGWMLVALGVIGEGISEALVSNADSNIQAFNNKRLAEVVKEAGDAKSSANGAADAADRAEKSASLAKKQAGEASTSSAKAGHTAAVAAVNARIALNDAGVARKQTLDTAAELRQEHDTRIELEKSIQPRNLPMIEAGKNNFEPLLPFLGQKYILEYVPDIEALRAASRILANVESAKWQLVKQPSANPEAYQSFFDGVVIRYFLPKEDAVTRMRSPADVAATERSEKAADALVQVLTSHGWTVRAQNGGKANTRSDGGKIRPHHRRAKTVGHQHQGRQVY